jgi:D-alanyl-D-alanine carboxypeptidase/D-alanyl-D-alanine-endopeptidase (penicillin-binding protein 4)
VTGFRKAVLVFLVLSLPCSSRGKQGEGTKFLLPFAELEKKGVEVSVYAELEGEKVVSFRADLPMNPASVTKIFTAALALHVLGADFACETRIFHRKTSKGQHEIFVKGCGDPMLESKDIEELAKCVTEKGIKKISSVALDLGPFTEEKMPPGYDQKDTTAPYRAFISGFQVDYNRFVVRVKPASSGKPPDVAISPESDYIVVENKAVSVKKGQDGNKNRADAQIKVAEKGGKLLVSVEGKVSKAMERGFAVFDPALFTMGALTRALRSQGALVEKAKVFLSTVPEDADPLCSHRSKPLSEMVKTMLKESQNQVAETLARLAAYALKKHPVGFGDAVEALSMFLKNVAHLDPRSFQIRNASGLYDSNRITAKETVKFLDFVLAHDEYRPLVAGLPVAGRDGTLKSRLKKTPLEGKVFAKTGTLDNVRALAGIMQCGDKGLLKFAVFAQSKGKLQGPAVRDATDKFLLSVFKERCEEEASPHP